MSAKENVRLTPQTWEKIEQLLTMENHPTARSVRNSISQQRNPEQVAIAFCGYPGAGVTTASKYAYDMLAKSVTHHNIALVTMADTLKVDDFEYIVADGVQSVDGYDRLRDRFDKVVLVRIRAPMYQRFTRLRDDEPDLMPRDITERDFQIWHEGGFRDLVEGSDDWAMEYMPDSDFANFDAGYIDEVVMNDGTLAELSADIRGLIRETTWLPDPPYEEAEA